MTKVKNLMCIFCNLGNLLLFIIGKISRDFEIIIAAYLILCIKMTQILAF